MSVLKLCPHAQICSVCSWIELSYEKQKQHKLKDLQQKLSVLSKCPEIEFIEVSPWHIRDRVDLTLENEKLGFYQKNQQGLFSVQECPQMSEGLAAGFQKLRKYSWKVKKGSVRLKHSPVLQKCGLWLDFSNEDVATLLKDETFLDSLSQNFIVEIGQRHKSLQKREDKDRAYGLADPQFHPWNLTLRGSEEISLWSTVKAFSQPGDLAIRKICEVISQWFSQRKYKSAIEFGSGIGTLTFPFSAVAEKFLALEYDEVAVHSLRHSVANHKLESSIQVIQGDFQTAKGLSPHEDSLPQADLVVVNPPRSGLKEFTKVAQSCSADTLFYMSCFADSFVVDAVKLQESGFQMQRLAILDQFPQSSHYEILSQWLRSSSV